MPIGASSYSPAPKSRCRWSSAPMLAMYSAERAMVGRAAMLRFQILSGGKTGQLMGGDEATAAPDVPLPGVEVAWAAPGTAETVPGPAATRPGVAVGTAPGCAVSQTASPKPR